MHEIQTYNEAEKAITGLDTSLETLEMYSHLAKKNPPHKQTFFILYVYLKISEMSARLWSVYM